MPFDPVLGVGREPRVNPRPSSAFLPIVNFTFGNSTSSPKEETATFTVDGPHQIIALSIQLSPVGDDNGTISSDVETIISVDEKEIVRYRMPKTSYVSAQDWLINDGFPFNFYLSGGNHILRAVHSRTSGPSGGTYVVQGGVTLQMVSI